MAVREVRGIFPGFLAQEDPTVTVNQGVSPSEDLGVQGRITPSGIVTVPVSTGFIGPVATDPVFDVSTAPTGNQTKEGAGQKDPFGGNALIVAGLLVIVFLVVLR